MVSVHLLSNEDTECGDLVAEPIKNVTFRDLHLHNFFCCDVKITFLLCNKVKPSPKMPTYLFSI